MKTKIIIVAASLITVGVMARIIAPFHGWGDLTETSPNVIVVKCGKPTPPNPDVIVMNGTKSDAEIQIVSVLKGTNDLSSARLLDKTMNFDKGKIISVFGYFDNGICKAYEEYRIVPLGDNFSTNSIAGKPLDEQIQIMFQRAVNKLDREIQTDEAEKGRLETGLKK